MRKTSILLPQALRDRAHRHARSLGISFEELIRRALTAMLRDVDEASGQDSFFADKFTHGGVIPRRASTSHDEHLRT